MNKHFDRFNCNIEYARPFDNKLYKLTRMYNSFNHHNVKADAFSNKDMLLVVVGFVCIILGYYFF